MEKLENAKAGKGHEGGIGDESRLAQHPRPSGHSCSAAVVHLVISLIHLIVIINYSHLVVGIWGFGVLE